MFITTKRATSAPRHLLYQYRPGVQETGITDRHKVNKYLTVLRELHIIRREVPVTEEKPHKSRKGIYLLDDPYFRFWFKYVFPNTSYLEEGDVDYVWEEKLKLDFDSFVGPIFEDICTQKIKSLNKDNQLPFKAKSIGRWWNREDEIDIVAMNDKGSFLFCNMGRSLLLHFQYPIIPLI